MFRNGIVAGKKEFTYPVQMCSVCIRGLEISYGFNSLNLTKDKTTKKFKRINKQFEKLMTSSAAENEIDNIFKNRGTQTIVNQSMTGTSETVQQMEPHMYEEDLIEIADQIEVRSSEAWSRPAQCETCWRSFRTVGGLKKVTCTELSLT